MIQIVQYERDITILDYIMLLKVRAYNIFFYAKYSTLR